jgi:hypothetical protein
MRHAPDFFYSGLKSDEAGVLLYGENFKSSEFPGKGSKSGRRPMKKFKTKISPEEIAQ